MEGQLSQQSFGGPAASSEIRRSFTMVAFSSTHLPAQHNWALAHATCHKHDARVCSVALVALVASLLLPSRDARLGRPIATDGNGMTRPGALTSEHSLGKRQGRMPVGRIGFSAHP